MHSPHRRQRKKHYRTEIVAEAVVLTGTSAGQESDDSVSPDAESEAI